MSKFSNKKYEKAPFEVCVVKYTCPTCYRRWHSANGNLEDYQICKNCYEKCYPGSYKYQAPNKRGNQNPETYIPHNTELCGKCIRLGHSCMEELGLERPNRVITNYEGESVSLDYSQDFSSYFNLAETSKKKPKNPISKKKQQLLDKQAWALLMDAGKKTVVKEDATNDKSEEKRVPEDVATDKSEEKRVPEVIGKEKVALVDNKENIVEEIKSNDSKENEVGKDEMADNANDCDNDFTKSKETYTEYIDYSDISTGDIICEAFYHEKFEEGFNSGIINKEDYQPDIKNTDGITTPTSTEEETEKDLTLESLLIADIKLNDKPLEDDDNKE